MAAYTPNKNITQPVYNEYASDPTGWTTTVNANWASIDNALGGVLSLNATGSVGTVALSITDTQNLIILITGVMTGNATYTLPANATATGIVGGNWVVYNNTSGAFTVTFSPSSGGGTSAAIPQGYCTTIFCDGTNVAYTETIPVSANSVTNAELAQIATARLKGRSTVGTGNVEDITMSAALDFISTAQGTVLYRNATNWVGLAPGTSGQFLKTLGVSANPTWDTLPSSLPSQTGNNSRILKTDGSSASWSPLALTAQGYVTTVSSASPTINFQRNITSITRSGTGKWDVVISGITNDSYTVGVMGGNGSGGVLVTPTILSGRTSSGFSIQWSYTNATGNVDPTAGFIVDINVFGGI